MGQLNFDEDIDTELLNAIQTILSAISTDRKKMRFIQLERDSLLDQIKCLEKCMEEQYIHKNSDGVVSHENKRKRIKTEPFKENNSRTSFHDVSNDELNSAFRTSMCEDDVIEPSQCPPYDSIMHKSKKISPRQILDSPKGQNKENNGILSKNKPNPKAIERSPTVLSKHISKTEIQHIPGKQPTSFHDPDFEETSFRQNESPKWQSKISKKNTTPRRLFDNGSISKSSPPQPRRSPLHTQTINANTRKKISLSLYSRTPRLKQSTLNFPKCDEETYCDIGVSFDADHLEMSEATFEPAKDVPVNLCSPSQNVHTRPEDIDVTADNDSAAFVITNSNDDHSTEEPCQLKRGVSSDLHDNYINIPSISLQKLSGTTEPTTSGKTGIGCKDCEKYHRMLGRDIEKDPAKKIGVCSKHRRNIQCMDTPPGFWNPTIIDSDSDHEDTPYDHRFVKKET